LVCVIRFIYVATGKVDQCEDTTVALQTASQGRYFTENADLSVKAYQCQYFVATLFHQSLVCAAFHVQAQQLGISGSLVETAVAKIHGDTVAAINLVLQSSAIRIRRLKNRFGLAALALSAFPASPTVLIL